MASVMLRERLFQKRVLEVAIDDDQNFLVTYNARGLGSECVEVDGRIAVRLWSFWWFNSKFEFRLGTHEAMIEVRFWPWLAVRSFLLVVDGEVAYREG